MDIVLLHRRLFVSFFALVVLKSYQLNYWNFKSIILIVRPFALLKATFQCFARLSLVCLIDMGS